MEIVSQVAELRPRQSSNADTAVGHAYPQCPNATDSIHELGQVFRPDCWSENARIRNISAAIRGQHADATFLNDKEAAIVLGMTVTKLAKVPVKELPRFKKENARWYAVVEVATYLMKKNMLNEIAGKTQARNTDFNS